MRWQSENNRQDHRNPTRFRNIWLRPLTPYDAV